MWKLINRITGEIRECKFEYVLREEWLDLIQQYKQDGIEVYVTYLGNQTYELKQYIVK